MFYNDMMYPRHWLQFADDSQSLLNVFTKWSKWTSFIIRIDKCKTFGVKKCGTKSLQYKPYLKVSGQMIPAIEIDDSFTYLGKMFSFEMKYKWVKKFMKNKFCEWFFSSVARSLKRGQPLRLT